MRYGSIYSKIQSESQNLTSLLRTFSGSRAVDCIFDHLNAMDKYTSKNKSKLLAKDFPTGHQWFNSKPLSLKKELKKKLIVIDFWTYCCINCLHVLPELEWLETKYADEQGVTFIGCHSAKFTNERESDKVSYPITKFRSKKLFSNTT